MLARMNVTVNGTAESLDGDAVCVEDLLERLGIEQQKGIAVALNLAVVPRSRWAEQQVRDGDEIEIVRATQGG